MTVLIDVMCCDVMVDCDCECMYDVLYIIIFAAVPVPLDYFYITVLTRFHFFCCYTAV